jgi:multidrug efflux pump subunit AcrA (membrane-fusion protein)
MKTNPLPILAAASLLLPGGPCAAETLRVKTTNPSTGEGLAVSSEQPAEVRAYYSTAIHSPAAGTIKTVEKDIGDRVAAGETIIVLTTAADPNLVEVRVAGRTEATLPRQRAEDLGIAEGTPWTPALAARVDRVAAGTGLATGRARLLALVIDGSRLPAD